MFSGLPSEVILNISFFLHITDKLSLVRTCRRLNNIISQWNLYQELSIPASKGVYTRDIVRKFKDGDLNGSQVLSLKLDLSQLTNQLYRRLPTIFPRVIELTNLTKDENCRNDFIIEPLSLWKDTLERYDIEKGHTQISKLFEKYTFSRLKELNISPNRSRIYHHNIAFSNKINLKVCLQHLPHLERLRLYQMELTIEILVKIHQSCQSLKSLKLANVLILIEQAYLSESIEPAMQMKSLELERNTIVCDPHGLLFDFILSKYPFLSELYLYFTFKDRNLRALLELPLGNDPMDAVQLNTKRRNLLTQGSTFYKTRDIYKESGGRFLGMLPKTISKFGINASLFNNTLESLDQADLSWVTTLDLVDERGQPAILFKDSLHYDYFYRLTSLTSLSVGISADMQGYEDNMNVLTKIKTVNLSISAGSGKHGIVKLEWLLSTFPSVKDFNIIYSEAPLMVESRLDARAYPCLKQMTIKKGLINENALDYLRIMAPEIRRIGWAIGGPAYQFKIPRSYYLELKIAKRKGQTKKDLPHIPDQISHYIDIKRYRLDHFHLWTDFIVDGELGEADINVEIIQPSRVHRYIFRAREDGTTCFSYHGDGVQSYKLREMTKVMVVCNTLKTFQLDFTPVITVGK